MGDHVHTDALIDLGTATEKTEKGQVLEQPGRAGQLWAHCCDTRFEQRKKKNQYWIQLSELNYFSQKGLLEN